MADRITGRRIPFFTRTEPLANIPQILASEVGQQKTPAVLAASLAKVVKPGQILGRIASTKELIPCKLAVVDTAIADTTAETEIVVDDASPFEVGDSISIALDGGAVTKTISAIDLDTNTITVSAAIGAGALSEGARVSTTAALGGTAVAIAPQYAAGGTGNTAPLEDAVAYQQMMEVYRAGRFKKRLLIGYNDLVLSDLGGKVQLGAVPPEQNGMDPDDVVVIP